MVRHMNSKKGINHKDHFVIFVIVLVTLKLRVIIANREIFVLLQITDKRSHHRNIVNTATALTTIQNHAITIRKPYILFKNTMAMGMINLAIGMKNLEIGMMSGMDAMDKNTTMIPPWIC